MYNESHFGILVEYGMRVTMAIRVLCVTFSNPLKWMFGKI